LEFHSVHANIDGEGPDYFEALCAVRMKLETMGFLIKAYGDSRKVFPSGMARDMGAGRRAYRLSLGRRARIKDVVSVFETGADAEPATVAEQQAFYHDWLLSIGAATDWRAR